LADAGLGNAYFFGPRARSQLSEVGLGLGDLGLSLGDFFGSGSCLQFGVSGLSADQVGLGLPQVSLGAVAFHAGDGLSFVYEVPGFDKNLGD
jgi:hypothetical protein